MRPFHLLFAALPLFGCAGDAPPADTRTTRPADPAPETARAELVLDRIP